MPLQMPVETMISTDDIATSLMGTDKLSGRTIGYGKGGGENRLRAHRQLGGGTWPVHARLDGTDGSVGRRITNIGFRLMRRGAEA